MKSLVNARIRNAVALLLVFAIFEPGSTSAQPSDETISNLARQVEQLHEQGRYEAAIPIAIRVLDLTEKEFGPVDPVTALHLNNLAFLYHGMGRYADADPLHQRALKIRESKLGPYHPATVMSLNNLAELYRDMSRYADAEPLCQRALKIRESLGPDSPDTAQSLNNLALLYRHTGRYADAVPLAQRALKIYESKFGPEHPLTATGLSNLATIYCSMGRHADAVPLTQRVLIIRESGPAPNHPLTAISLNNLATIYCNMGRLADAEPLYQRALKISESGPGPNHPDTALCLDNLAFLYYDMDRFADAEPLYQRALIIRESKLGPDHPDTATSLDNLATLYRDMSRYADAEPLYQRALEISESKFGPNHPDTALYLDNLATLYRWTGRRADAEPLYQRALKIRELKLEPDHPLTAQSLTNLGILLAGEERWEDALNSFDRVRHVLLRHVTHALPMLAEKDQLSFLKYAVERSLAAALSFACSRANDPNTATRSAAWVVNGKALAHQTLAERALLARTSTLPNAKKLVQQLNLVRSQLAAATLANPKPEQEERRKSTLDQLRRQELELSKDLAQLVGRPVRDEPWVELDEVRDAVRDDSVLIEIARFNTYDFQAKDRRNRWLAPRYAAWIIPTAGLGQVQIVDLGDAKAIDKAVQDARDALKIDPKDLSERGESEVEQRARPSLQALADLVLKPLLPHIEHTKNWVLSPDADLWLFPWAALPIDDRAYVVETHDVHYVISGRDLVLNAESKRTGSAFIVADPDFQLGPDEARAATQAVLRSTKALDQSILALRGTSTGFNLANVSPLPGTAAEAKAITPSLKTFANIEPTLYTGKYALEGVFKAFQNPRVVVLSTHGFFLADQEIKPEGGQLGEPSRAATARVENPLLRCGLLLAGCSRADAANGGEDGVLTGLEIVGAHLEGTELVVLSACETGLGQVRNGEGVAGLRQSFQLAGVRSVVATLWQIPDRESARLMAAFFDKLASGQGKGASLREAQLEQIAVRRKRHGGAHPFFWAAYTLTGQDD